VSKAKTKMDIAKAALDIIQQKLGGESASLLRESSNSSAIATIPTGIEVLDYYVLRCGGLPRGRIIELFSAEGVGKTSLGYTFLAAAQRAGGVGQLIDTENSFDPERARVFGVNTEDLLISQPNHLEEVVSYTEVGIDALSSVAPGSTSVVVWDSVAATQTKAEFEGGVESKDKMGERAKFLSRAMRVLGGRTATRPVLLVCINQVRENIGVMFGDKYVTPGGHAIKFHASVRLQLFPGKSVKNTVGEHIGKTIKIVAVKNRFAPPFRKADVRLDFATGWNNIFTTVSHAKDVGVIAANAKYNRKSYEEALGKLGWAAASQASIEVADVMLNEDSGGGEDVD